MAKKRASLTSEKAKASLGAVGLLARVGGFEEADSEIRQVPIKQIVANPYQPRITFVQERLEELAASIRQHGFYGHLWVRQKGRKYELVYGERRLRAAQVAGLSTIPVEVRSLTDEQMLEIALTENVQREDLSSVEEALAYQRMQKELGQSIRTIAKRIGKSVGYVSSLLSLLRYPEIQEAVEAHGIPVRTAEELAKVEDASRRGELLQLVIDGKLDRQGVIHARKHPQENASSQEGAGGKVRGGPQVFQRIFKTLERQELASIAEEDREESVAALKQIITQARALLRELKD